MAWSNEESDAPHGNKVSSATIRVDVTPIKCAVLPKWLTESRYDLHIHCTTSRQGSNHHSNANPNGRINKTHIMFFLPTFWLMMPHTLCKTMPSNPSPWLVMTSKFFPPWCQVCPPACLVLVRHSILASNQTKQARAYLAHLCGLAPLPLP